jgi:hypothetical protein
MGAVGVDYNACDLSDHVLGGRHRVQQLQHREEHRHHACQSQTSYSGSLAGTVSRRESQKVFANLCKKTLFLDCQNEILNASS